MKTSTPFAVSIIAFVLLISTMVFAQEYKLIGSIVEFEKGNICVVATNEQGVNTQVGQKLILRKDSLIIGKVEIIEKSNGQLKCKILWNNTDLHKGQSVEEQLIDASDGKIGIVESVGNDGTCRIRKAKNTSILKGRKLVLKMNGTIVGKVEVLKDDVDVLFVKILWNNTNIYGGEGLYEDAIEDSHENNKATNEGTSFNLTSNEAEHYEKELTAAILSDSDNPDLYNLRGILYAEIGKYKLAINDFSKAIQYTHRNADVYELYFNRGLAYYYQGDTENAINDISKAIMLNPSFYEAYVQRGNILDVIGNSEKAIEDYNKAMAINSNDYLIYYNRGVALYNLNILDKAINDFNIAIQLNPNHAIAYMMRGNAYTDIGQTDKAINDFNKVILSDSRNAAAYNDRGYSYFLKGDYAQSISDYNKAIDIDPKFALAYLNRGNVYRDLNETQTAISDYSKAIALEPKYLIAYNRRGIAYASISRYDLAIADHTEAIRLNPDHADSYHLRGNAYDLSGNHTKALVDYNKAIELSPDVPMFYYDRAVYNLQQQNYIDAINDASKAIELDPSLAEAYSVRGIAYIQNYEKSHGVNDLKHYLKLNPSSINKDTINKLIEENIAHSEAHDIEQNFKNSRAINYIEYSFTLSNKNKTIIIDIESGIPIKLGDITLLFKDIDIDNVRSNGVLKLLFEIDRANEKKDIILHYSPRNAVVNVFSNGVAITVLQYANGDDNKRGRATLEIDKAISNTNNEYPNIPAPNNTLGNPSHGTSPDVIGRPSLPGTLPAQPGWCRTKEDQLNPSATYQYKGGSYRCNCVLGQSVTCRLITHGQLGSGANTDKGDVYKPNTNTDILSRVVELKKGYYLRTQPNDYAEDAAHYVPDYDVCAVLDNEVQHKNWVKIAFPDTGWVKVDYVQQESTICYDAYKFLHNLKNEINKQIKKIGFCNKINNNNESLPVNIFRDYFKEIIKKEIQYEFNTEKPTQMIEIIDQEIALNGLSELLFSAIHEAVFRDAQEKRNDFTCELKDNSSYYYLLRPYIIDKRSQTWLLHFYLAQGATYYLYFSKLNNKYVIYKVREDDFECCLEETECCQGCCKDGN